MNIRISYWPLNAAFLICVLASNSTSGQSNPEEGVENICFNVAETMKGLAESYNEGDMTQEKWEALRKDDRLFIDVMLEAGFDEESAELQLTFIDLYAKYFWKGNFSKWDYGVEHYGADRMITNYRDTTYKHCVEELRRVQ